MKLTGAAIPVSRGMKVLQAAPAAYPYRSTWNTESRVWWELAQNPRVVLAYYSSPPSLLGVELHSVKLHRDGPTLEVLAEMPGFPDRPSPRWPAGANTAQAVLRFLDLREFAISGWGTTNVGDLLIEDGGGGVRFRFESPTAQLSGVARFFDVPGISGYIKCNAEPDGVLSRGDF